MANSYKNTSNGGNYEGAKGNYFQKIGENKPHTPPPGASNSYEKVREKIDGHDRRALSTGRYTNEKMMNK